MGLAENAATLAGRTEIASMELSLDSGSSEDLPDVDIAEPGPDGPDQVPVYVAWSRVMGVVRKIAKADRFTAQGGYNFRGVDRAVNAFGPACRAHGVLVLPVKVDATYRDTKTSGGKPARECTVIVTYRIVGPAGDFLEAQAAGESLDSADKGSAKAQSVALRTMLLHSGLVPTGDPDPDMFHVERGEAPVRPAVSYLDEVVNPMTSVGRLRQIHQELQSTRQAAALVTNEVGEEEPIGAMVVRIGKERAGGGVQ